MNSYDIIFDGKAANNKGIIETYFFENDDKPIPYFPQFSQINIIVGANNSGKSRFIRFLMGEVKFLGIMNITNLESLISTYNDEVSVFNNSLGEIIKRIDSGYYGTNTQQRAQLTANKLFPLTTDYEKLDEIVETNKQSLKKLASVRDIHRKLLKNDYIAGFNFPPLFFKKFETLKKYYIPTLRTAHSLFEEEGNKIENDIYLHTLNKYYKLNMFDVEVFTGLHLHKQILNTRNSKRSIRESFEKFEKFIGKYFFAENKLIL